MFSGQSLIIIVGLLFLTAILYSQNPDSTFQMGASIYDVDFNPVAATHVINMNNHVGDVSDSLGVFSLPVGEGDTLFFRNIAYREILVPVKQILENGYVVLEKIFYPLQEARVFPWGSSYEDFSRAIVNTPAPETLGESLGLPRKDPGYVPFDMDESLLKSTGFMLSSPISYLYYNHNKKEKKQAKTILE